MLPDTETECTMHMFNLLGDRESLRVSKTVISVFTDLLRLYSYKLSRIPIKRRRALISSWLINICKSCREICLNYVGWLVQYIFWYQRWASAFFLAPDRYLRLLNTLYSAILKLTGFTRNRYILSHPVI